MRVAELSRRTGVPVPTIKYYLREGLLARGELSRPNQASYGEGHVRRLRLVRALIETGGLPVATVRDVLGDVDAAGPDLDRRLGRVMGSISHVPAEAAPVELAAARARVDALIETHGWSAVAPGNPSRRALEELVAALGRLQEGVLLVHLDRYAEIATRTAEVDLDALEGIEDTDAVLEHAVVGTVLGDTLLSHLRRVAQAAESGRRTGARGAVVPRSTDGIA